MKDKTMTEDQKKIAELDAKLTQVYQVISAFVKGEHPLPHSNIYAHELLSEFRRWKQSTDFFSDNPAEFPNLQLTNGSSGLEVRAIFPESYSHVEYTLDRKKEQTLMVAPWHQFPNSKEDDHRSKLMFELLRRAMLYEGLVKENKNLQHSRTHANNQIDEFQEQRDRYIEMWREERVKFGLPADFSDIPETAWRKRI